MPKAAGQRIRRISTSSAEEDGSTYLWSRVISPSLSGEEVNVRPCRVKSNPVLPQSKSSESIAIASFIKEVVRVRLGVDDV